MSAQFKLILGLAFCFVTNLIYGQITVLSYGGDNTKAQEIAFYQAFNENFAENVNSVIYNGDLTEIKRQIASKNDWQVLELEGSELVRGCDAKLFELLSLRNMQINANYLIDGASKVCGVGFLVYSNVLAYNANNLAQTPQNWQDFWDVKKFPGKRSLRKNPKTTLEFALLADGVELKDVYKVLSTEEGQDLAFAKLDELKPHIIWWEDGQQATDLLASGKVVMSSIYNGRITQEIAKKGIKFTWNEGLYEFSYWAIPKGAKNQPLIYDFIRFTLSENPQKNFMQNINYSGTNKKAMQMLNANQLSVLPTATNNFKMQRALDTYFWVDNGDKLEQRFNKWLKQ